MGGWWLGDVRVSLMVLENRLSTAVRGGYTVSCFSVSEYSGQGYKHVRRSCTTSIEEVRSCSRQCWSVFLVKCKYEMAVVETMGRFHRGKK